MFWIFVIFEYLNLFRISDFEFRIFWLQQAGVFEAVVAGAADDDVVEQGNCQQFFPPQRSDALLSNLRGTRVGVSEGWLCSAIIPAPKTPDGRVKTIRVDEIMLPIRVPLVTRAFLISLVFASRTATRILRAVGPGNSL